MKTFTKILLAIVMVTLVGGCGVLGYFTYTMYSEKNALIEQNAEVQSQLDAIGPITQCWTVTTEYKQGTTVKDETFLQQMPMPESGVTEAYVMDTSQIVGKSLKVKLQPGTPITTDVLMDDERPDDITYFRDLTFSYLPMGIEDDDYLDINMTLPYGEMYKVIQHCKVLQISNNVVKVVFTESELARWESALKDYALWGGFGLSLWCAQYEEPGLDQNAIPFYPVRLDAESIVTLNPNITNKAECINTEIRKDLDTRLALVDEESGKLSATGVTTEASTLNTAVEAYKQALDKAAAEANVNQEVSMDEANETVNEDGTEGVTSGDIIDAAGEELSANPSNIQ